MSVYRKALVTVLGAVLVAVAAALSDGDVTVAEKVQIAIAAFAAFQVWLTANTGAPLSSAAKAITAGALAALALVASYLVAGDTLTGAQWLNAAIAFGTAAGVWAVPNADQFATAA